MTPQEQALARRAVACNGWRWLPGMAVTDPTGVSGRIEAVSCTGHSAWVVNERGRAWICAPDMLTFDLDLNDPATLGCLLALVTAAYRWEMLPYMDSKGDWGVRRAIPGYGPKIPSTHRTKAAALVAALEAAPVRAGGEE